MKSLPKALAISRTFPSTVTYTRLETTMLHYKRASLASTRMATNVWLFRFVCMKHGVMMYESPHSQRVLNGRTFRYVGWQPLRTDRSAQEQYIFIQSAQKVTPGVLRGCIFLTITHTTERNISSKWDQTQKKFVNRFPHAFLSRHDRHLAGNWFNPICGITVITASMIRCFSSSMFATCQILPHPALQA